MHVSSTYMHIGRYFRNFSLGIFITCFQHEERIKVVTVASLNIKIGEFRLEMTLNFDLSVYFLTILDRKLLNQGLFQLYTFQF